MIASLAVLTATATATETETETETETATSYGRHLRTQISIRRWWSCLHLALLLPLQQTWWWVVVAARCDSAQVETMLR